MHLLLWLNDNFIPHLHSYWKILPSSLLDSATSGRGWCQAIERACYFQTKTRASSSRADLLDCVHAITWQPDGMLGKSVGFTLRVCLVNSPQKTFGKGGLNLGRGLDKPSAYYIQRTAIGYSSGFLLEATTLEKKKVLSAVLCSGINLKMPSISG